MGKLICGDSLRVLKKQPPKSVDTVIGSPPYPEKGERYGPGAKKWPTNDWVTWMAEVTVAALAVSRNVVVWVVNGAVADGCYLPACEGLVWTLYQQGIRCERPVVWSKNAPPNRGQNWFANAWEYCLAFRPADSTSYFDWESIGTEPKFKAGGQFRQRNAKGDRKLGNLYPQVKLARPRDMIEADLEPLDVIRATVGGGHMGSKLAHCNHAPYPEKLVFPFVRALVPRGGTVCDPFCGSGTTLSVAEQLGVDWLGIDSDRAQIELCQRRIKETREKMKGAAGG